MDDDHLDGHRYNDDLLIGLDECNQAKREFPTFSHVLIHEEFRDWFAQHDRKANVAKRHALTAGLWAVVLAVLAIGIAASQSVWQDWRWSSFVAVASALAGVGAILISVGGVLHGKKKEQWLHDRLCTERARQFHFQTFLSRLDEVCASSKDKAKFNSQRQAWFGRMVQDFDNSAEAKLTQILGTEGFREVWIHGIEPTNAEVPHGFDATELFQAYRSLRLVAQLDYANYKLREDRWTWDFRKMSLRQQKRTLNLVWLVAFGGLALAHVYVVVAVLGSIHLLTHTALHVTIVWFALVGLGSKTIQEGLAISREIERYEDYRMATRNLLTRFDAADTDRKRLEVMVEMERLAFEEMRSFLRSNDEASFVL